MRIDVRAVNASRRPVTRDRGNAMLGGKWTDIAKTKGPMLRGVAGRAPYFHDGSARDLKGVVDFYGARLDIGLTP